MSSLTLPSYPGLAWENTIAPMFSTKIQTSVGGSEVRAAFQPYPIHRYALVHEFLRSSVATVEMQGLWGFYCTMLGSWDTFLFTDPNDNAGVVQNFGVGDGSTKIFQLYRVLSGAGGAFGFAEPVYNILGAQIYVNGVLQTLGSQYSLSNGVVTFVTAPGVSLPLSWNGAYQWRCRFEDDALEFSQFANLYFEQRGLKFRTVLGA